MSMFRTLLETMGQKGRKKVEYLQSTGTQYIDADLPNNPNGFRVDVGFAMMSTDSNQIIWGVEDADSPYYRNYFKYSNSSTFQLGCYGYQNIYYSTTTGTRYDVSINTVRNTTQYVYINGQSAGATDNNKSSARSSATSFIFALNGGGSPWGYTKIKLYYIRFYDSNDNLIRDFEPSLDSDGVACLYDIVSKTYFYNQGTGDFLYGSVIPDYTEVNYIKTTGTQWIDTRYYPTYLTNYEIDMELTNPIPRSWQQIVASTMYNNADVKLYCGSDVNNNIRAQIYNDPYNTILPNSNSGRIKIRTDGSDIYYNDAFYVTINRTRTGTENNYMWIANAPQQSNLPTDMTIYSFKMWENGVLIKDLIPVLNNGIACLYDKVNNIYYYNRGTGLFLYG